MCRSNGRIPVLKEASLYCIVMDASFGLVFLLYRLTVAGTGHANSMAPKYTRQVRNADVHSRLRIYHAPWHSSVASPEAAIMLAGGGYFKWQQKK